MDMYSSYTYARARACVLFVCVHSLYISVCPYKRNIRYYPSRHFNVTHFWQKWITDLWMF